jgi:hypothetical protein
MGCKFQTGREVVEIQKPAGMDLYKIFCAGGGVVESSRCVCTFPAKDVLKLKVGGQMEYRSWMAEWKRTIRSSIYGGSLCRIYSVFPPEKESGKPWFSGLGKLTMDNDVRYIIPIDE